MNDVGAEFASALLGNRQRIRAHDSPKHVGFMAKHGEKRTIILHLFGHRNPTFLFLGDERDDFVNRPVYRIAVDSSGTSAQCERNT